ncbi:hypothetical protein, partial [Zoogloea sp.]|uniref:hypothetical protein n=1 Tax=Zoogloea sp. TaxID=49181 RepID=UPI0035B3E1AB
MPVLTCLLIQRLGTNPYKNRGKSPKLPGHIPQTRQGLTRRPSSPDQKYIFKNVHPDGCAVSCGD